MGTGGRAPMAVVAVVSVNGRAASATWNLTFAKAVGKSALVTVVVHDCPSETDAKFACERLHAKVANGR